MENGKERTEIVEGNVTSKATLLGLRVKSAKIDEDDEGGASATATIVGVGRGLVRLVGESVQVATVSGGRRLAGHVRWVKVQEGKDGGPKTVTVNLAAAREIDRLVGNQVRLEKAQGELPGLAADVEAEEGPAPLGEVDALRALRPRGHQHAVNPPPRKKRRARGREAVAGADR